MLKQQGLILFLFYFYCQDILYYGILIVKKKTFEKVGDKDIILSKYLRYFAGEISVLVWYYKFEMIVVLAISMK